MSADWYQCTKDEQALIASAKPGEICILFGKHGVRKLTISEWQDIYFGGLIEAAQAAAAQLGIRCEKGPGDSITIDEGDMVGDRWDIELSTITVTLRATDGREGVGVAHLLPPDASVAVN
jgi:hypothetical protein